jgi:uncharacterized membrane protein
MSNYTKVIAASIVIGACINGIGLILAAVVAGNLGLSSVATLVAVMAALLASGTVEYLVFVGTLRKHFQQEAEDKLFNEIEQDQPRRFDETNFK